MLWMLVVAGLLVTVTVTVAREILDGSWQMNIGPGRVAGYF
jgi:hypothetical protein